MLLLVCLVVFGGAACQASSPADLFWRIEADAMAEGGADVPGQISLRPQVERPASLPAAGDGGVRISAAEYAPIRLSRAEEQVGRWDCSASTVDVFLPLSAPGDTGWTLGLQQSRSTDDAWFYETSIAPDADADYRLGMETTSQMVGAAYRDRSGLTLAAARRWGTSKASAQGSRLAGALGLSNDRSWPAVETEFTDHIVGGSLALGEWECGVQRTWSEPRTTMELTRKSYKYSAPMESDGASTEGYIARRLGAESYFACLSDGHSTSSGTIFMGAVGRGDVSFETRERSFMLGWRREEGRRLRQLVLDRRVSSMAGRAQGYTGFLPGISSDVYTLRLGYDVSTVSARYAYRRPLSGSFDVLASTAVQYSNVDAQFRIRRARGFWSNPKTVTEYAVDEGIVRMFALALGVGYEDGNCSASLVCTGGLAGASEIVTDPSGEPSEEPSLQMQPDLFFTFRFEYLF
ncbi:MAG TPA: hypothetical protein DGT21_14860 [Armatimonadetes bacterium]|nr:hypothetical protein [Armatimonadota bacterium]